MANTTDKTETITGEIGAMVGAEMKVLRDTLSALEARATALETKAGNYQPKPNAEFFRYVQRVSLNPTVRQKDGEVALGIHVYGKSTAGKAFSYFFYIEEFMAAIAKRLFPDLYCSPTLKLVIGDMGRVMAYGKFFDKSGTYTRIYDMGNVFIKMSTEAANYVDVLSLTEVAKDRASGVINSHPIVRSEGGTTVTVGTASDVTSDWVPFYKAVAAGFVSGTTPSMDCTTGGKWAGDLMKCWIEMQGVDNTSTYARQLYDAWVAYITRVCRSQNPSFTLVFSNRAGTPASGVSEISAYPD